MVRASKKKRDDSVAASASIPNPESTERQRLKKLAFSNTILSQTPSKLHLSLAPSKTVLKHHGADILKKSTRKNRFLFSFPGLVAPVAGGKIGELKDLGSKNPILYLDFPQGRMKLFGTIVYPQNRYLTLQFSRGGKNVMCEDCFDNMIVFSDAWWIGSKDDNPEEARLDFPKEMIEGQNVDYDFKGGAGGAFVDTHGAHETGTKCAVKPCKAESEDDSSDTENILTDLNQTTPVRHSERTARKKFNFAESSSGGDSVGSDADTQEEKVNMDLKSSTITTGKSCSVVLDFDEKDATGGSHEEYQECSVLEKKPKSNAKSSSHQGSLVQATISTLFKKVEEKKVTKNPRKSSSLKVSGGKSQQTNLKRKTDQAEGSRKKSKVVKEKSRGKGVTAEKKESEIEEDDIEEFTSLSKDANESDEDWVA